MFEDTRQVVDKVVRSGGTLDITRVGRCAHSADIDGDNPVVILRCTGPNVRSTRPRVRVVWTRSPNLEFVNLVFPYGPNTRPAMNEDESVLCARIHIYIIYHHEVGLERGDYILIRFRERLTDFNGRRFICSPVHSWTPGDLVLPGERELGKYGSAEEGEGERGQQHVIQYIFQPATPVVIYDEPADQRQRQRSTLYVDVDYGGDLWTGYLPAKNSGTGVTEDPPVEEILNSL